MSGELAKVIIRGYKLPEENAQQGEVVAEFHAMFNPESFGVANAFAYDESQADSDTGSEFKFKNIAPREFSFDFVVDSTGAGGSQKEVEEEVKQFKNATGFTELAGFVGQQRRTFYLTITWGTFNIRCILKNMDVTYTLFRPDGSPVRATISATFAEYKTPQQQARENPESLLNLTQVREVLDHDNLANLAKNLYGDGNKYIALAKANGINNLKELLSGSRLEFPPVDQLAESLPGQLSSFTDRAQQIVQGAQQLAEGKGQIVQSASQLADSARQRAQTALTLAEAAAGQLQGQAQEQFQSLLQQGQNISGQLQSQAQGQLQSLLQQGQNISGQLQSQAQGQLQSLLQQGQNASGQLQSQAGQLAQRATQFAQGAGQGLLENAEQFTRGAGQGLLENVGQLAQGSGGGLLQSGRDALSEGFDNITNFFDF